MALTLKKVLISDEVDQICVDILQKNGVEVVKNTQLSKEQLVSEISKYDGLIVRSATKVTAEVIAAASNLKIIGRAGTGVDNIDCDAATKKGIIVMNTPGGNTMSAAEHTCAMLLAMSRHISEGTCSMRAGRWDRKKLMGNEVFGRTLAIVGLGRIGREVASRMQAFGMKTIGFDPLVSAEESATFGVEWLALDDIWPQADYVTVHVPLIPPTKNMIGDEMFKKCKKGLRVINVARGGVVDEDAVLRALETGQCGGAALDVFAQEPPTDQALLNHPKVTVTPHLGASTKEAQTRVAEEIAQQFVDMVQGKQLFGAINADALTNALSPRTKPWVDLGSSLGKIGASFLGQVNSQTQIKVSTEGSSLADAASYLKAAVLVGLLKSQSQNGLNLVSAPALAKDLGIKVTSEHKDQVTGGLSELMSVSLQQPGGATYNLYGLVAANKPVLVAINDAIFAQGVNLEGDLLVYKSPADLKVLTSVTGSLASTNTAVQSFVSSAAVNGESWSIMRTAPALKSLETVKQHVNFAQILSF